MTKVDITLRVSISDAEAEFVTPMNVARQAVAEWGNGNPHNTFPHIEIVEARWSEGRP